MKLVLGALAAAVVASVAFVQPAEARCFWNGFAWQCHHHGPSWDRGWHRGWDHHGHGGWDQFRLPARLALVTCS